jgi:hypothetical protein
MTLLQVTRHQYLRSSRLWRYVEISCFGPANVKKDSLAAWYGALVEVPGSGLETRGKKRSQYALYKIVWVIACARGNWYAQLVPSVTTYGMGYD